MNSKETSILVVLTATIMLFSLVALMPVQPVDARNAGNNNDNNRGGDCSDNNGRRAICK